VSVVHNVPTPFFAKISAAQLFFAQQLLSRMQLAMRFYRARIVWHSFRKEVASSRRHQFCGSLTMVAKISQRGLIVSTRTKTSPTLEELAAGSGWPALVGANARTLMRELSAARPACVLFWLDDLRNVASTAGLIHWLRDRYADPYRVAVACNLASNAEAALRAAGAHSYLPISHDSTTSVMESLRPLFDAIALGLETPVAPSISPAANSGYVAQSKYPSDLVQPP
jgi:hypothetical protein